MSSVDVVEVECKNGGRLLNELARGGLRVKRAEQRGKNLLIYTYYKDRTLLIALFEKLCYNYRVVKTYGFFRALKIILFKRGGIAVVVFAAALLAVLPTFTLKLVVTGADATKDGVYATLTGYGIKRGARHNRLDTKAVEQSLEGLDGVAFATVIKRGTRLYVTVVEELPKEELFYLTEQAEVRAAVDAVITRQVTLSGVSLVTRGQTVRAGQPLIAGYVLVGEEKVPTAARGEVYGLVYYTATASGAKPSDVAAEASLKDEATERALEKTPLSARVTNKWTSVKELNGIYVVEAVVEVEQRIDDGIT